MAAVPAAQFEGTVKGTMTMPGIQADMVQHMRGLKMRVDYTMPGAGGNVSMIMDKTAGNLKWLMVAHEEKMWMDMAMMSGMIPGFAASEPPPTEFEIPEYERTERVEEIAGYECRHYIFKFEENEVDLCVTPGLGCFVPGTPAGLRGGESSSLPQLPQTAEVWLREFGDGFFVLSMSTMTDEGEATIRVSELEAKLVPEEMFVPPAEYQEMKMPGR